MSFIEGEITVEFGGTVGPAGPAGNAVPIAAGTVLANPSGVLANPVGVDAAGMRTLIGAIGGSTGATDNRILRSDGTGGATVQNSAVTIDDSGNVSGVAGLTVTLPTSDPQSNGTFWNNSGSVSASVVPTWSAILTPTGLSYLFVTHNQELYYDTILKGWAFRPANLFSDTAGTTLVTKAGDRIATWNDTSGAGFSAQQATANTRPTLQFVLSSNGIYYPVVRCSGHLTNGLVTTASVPVWPSKRGGIYNSFQPFTADTAAAFNWSGPTYYYSWYTSRFYDGAFSGANTGGFDNGIIKTAIVRTTDTNRAYYKDGVLVNNTTGTDSAAFTSAMNMGVSFGGDLHAMCATTSGTYSTTVNDFIASMSPSLTIKDNRIAFDGNSLTQGVGATGPSGGFVTQVTNALGSSWTTYNFGIASQVTTAMTSAGPTRIDPVLVGAKRKVVVVWEVTNDLYFGASAATAYANLVACCERHKSVGHQVIVMTVLPRSGGVTPGTFEADRQTVNTSIRTNWPLFADGIADVGDDPMIGVTGADTNTKYYTDLVHMTRLGYRIVANYVIEAIATLRADY
jgi:lysophospholipase L1-like esterase